MVLVSNSLEAETATSKIHFFGVVIQQYLHGVLSSAHFASFFCSHIASFSAISRSGVDESIPVGKLRGCLGKGAGAFAIRESSTQRGSKLTILQIFGIYKESPVSWKMQQLR